MLTSQEQLNKQPQQPQIVYQQISPWGALGSLVADGCGWLLKNVAPAFVAGIAGGYAYHKLSSTEEVEEEESVEETEE